MGVIDERDDDQSFMDWFIHGSRKKAEKKKQEKEAKKQAQNSELQKKIEEDIKLQDQLQIEQIKEKNNQIQQIVQQAQHPAVVQSIAQKVQQPQAVQAPVQQQQNQQVQQPSQQVQQIQSVQEQKKPENKKEEKKIVLQRPSKYPKFVLSRQKLNPLPFDAKEATYPLISPYSYAEIKNVDGLMVYNVIEPIIDENERAALEKLKTALIHFIDLPMSSVKEERELIEFLEEKVQWLLEETDIYVDEKSYTKIMYYLYRDFIGLNALEPLLRDSYVEDLGCDGTGVPIYAIHQKFGTLRTNVVFDDEEELKEFVVKLSQRCNRYISYAEPMLDGSLPDGTRINATLARDVTSRGPTFSIRKFRDKPFSPIEMVGFKTADPDMLAYLWIAIENGSSLLLCGGTGTGKCVIGDTPIYLADGSIRNIKEIVEEKFEKAEVKLNDGWEYVDGDGTEMLSMDKNNLKIIKARIDKFWRHKASESLVKIKTRSGREITTTPEHPFFILNNGNVEKVRADSIVNGIRIAAPRKIDLNNKNRSLDLTDFIKEKTDIYLVGCQEEIINALKIIKNKGKSASQIVKENGISYKRLNEWKSKNSIPISWYFKLIQEAGLVPNKKLILKGKTSPISITIPNISSDLYKFVAYVIADGHLTPTSVQFNNINKELRKEFKNLGEKIFNIKGIEEFPKNRTPKIVFFNKPIATILNEVFEIPYENKARKVKVPESLYLQDNKSIAEFIQAISDCESHVGRTEIEISTTSKELSEGLSRLLLRLGIVSYKITRKNHYRIYISGTKNLENYQKNINYMHPEKSKKLNNIVNRHLSKNISNVDLVPNSGILFYKAREQLNLTKKQFAENMFISRRMCGMIEAGERTPSIHTFKAFDDYIEETDIDLELKNRIKMLADSDIFWDEVIEAKELTNHQEKYVYDLTIPHYNNFLAGDIPIVAHNTSFLNSICMFTPEEQKIVSIEDTREIRLNHENWLPAVARMGFGGTKTGEVTMFDLLKESFRQNPNYIIVGEVRGEEAAVMFQAMASGMTAMSTMHAGSADDALKRLQTRPISLPPTLMETLDLLIVMTHAYEKSPSARRVKEIAEIESVSAETNKVNVNRPFVWDPVTDSYKHNENHLLKKIAAMRGYSDQYMQQELADRKKVIEWLVSKQFDWKTVTEHFAEYRRNKEKVMKLVLGQEELKEQKTDQEIQQVNKDVSEEKTEPKKEENIVQKIFSTKVDDDKEIGAQAVS